MARSTVTFDRATPADLDAVVALLDEEFVAGRGRTGSFRVRFPSVYAAERAGDIVLARDPGGIAGIAAIKCRALGTGDRPIRLAMVGGVWIRSELRGQGVGQLLMGEVERSFSREGADVAVLWTGTPAFYEKTGWRSKDAGVFGAVEVMPPPGSRTAQRVTLDSMVVGGLEELRVRQPVPGLERTVADYATMPPPAERVECIVTGSSERPDAYALFGCAGDAVYVYEMNGDAAHFGALLAEAGRGASQVFINDHPGSASYAWLASRARVAWRQQHLAMWKVFADWVHWEQLDGGPIPLMDRI